MKELTCEPVASIPGAKKLKTSRIKGLIITFVYTRNITMNAKRGLGIGWGEQSGDYSGDY